MKMQLWMELFRLVECGKRFGGSESELALATVSAEKKSNEQAKQGDSAQRQRCPERNAWQHTGNEG